MSHKKDVKNRNPIHVTNISFRIGNMISILFSFVICSISIEFDSNLFAPSISIERLYENGNNYRFHWKIECFIVALMLCWAESALWFLWLLCLPKHLHWNWKKMGNYLLNIDRIWVNSAYNLLLDTQSIFILLDSPVSFNLSIKNLLEHWNKTTERHNRMEQRISINATNNSNN